jgi:hypothetical protein
MDVRERAARLCESAEYLRRYARETRAAAAEARRESEAIREIAREQQRSAKRPQTRVDPRA